MSSDGRQAVQAFQSARNGGTRCPLTRQFGGVDHLTSRGHGDQRAGSGCRGKQVPSRRGGCAPPLHFPNNPRTHTDDCWTTEHR